jgi:uncharacterized protein (DUF433 family)
MAPTETRYEHIVVSEQNVPIIGEANFKVIQLVESYLAHRWSAEELHEQFPTLTMGQIHSALAYYWDNKEEIDRQIEQELQPVEQRRQAQGPSPFNRAAKRSGARLVALLETKPLDDVDRKDLDIMEQSIEEGCERIDPSEW